MNMEELIDTLLLLDNLKVKVAKAQGLAKVYVSLRYATDELRSVIFNVRTQETA